MDRFLPNLVGNATWGGISIWINLVFLLFSTIAKTIYPVTYLVMFAHLCACCGLQCNYRSLNKRFQDLLVQLYEIHATCKSFFKLFLFDTLWSMIYIATLLLLLLFLLLLCNIYSSMTVNSPPYCFSDYFQFVFLNSKILSFHMIFLFKLTQRYHCNVTFPVLNCWQYFIVLLFSKNLELWDFSALLPTVRDGFFCSKSYINIQSNFIFENVSLDSEHSWLL